MLKSVMMAEYEHLSDYVDGFSRYMETATRLLPVTRVRYAYEVRAFAKAVGDPPLNSVTPMLLLAWNARFQEKGSAASTVIQKHAALKKFFGYLEEFGESEHAGRLLRVMQRQLQVPRDRGPVRPAYALEEGRVEMMMNAIGTRLSTGIRDRAIIHFLWSTGVRNSELTGLEMPGLDLRNRLANVVGKGDKERLVVFNAACRDDLATWLDIRKDCTLRSNYVFISISGTRLAARTVNGIVKDAVKLAGFRQEVWPHVFRHTRITELLENGMSLPDTAVMAGHTDPRTTMRYFHQDTSRLKEAYDAAMS